MHKRFQLCITAVNHHYCRWSVKEQLIKQTIYFIIFAWSFVNKVNALVFKFLVYCVCFSVVLVSLEKVLAYGWKQIVVISCVVKLFLDISRFESERRFYYSKMLFFLVSSGWFRLLVLTQEVYTARPIMNQCYSSKNQFTAAIMKYVSLGIKSFLSETS